MGKPNEEVLRFHSRKPGGSLRTFLGDQQVTPDRDLAAHLNDGLAGQHVLASIRKSRDSYSARFIRRVNSVTPERCHGADVLIDGQYFLKGMVTYLRQHSIEPELLLQKMLKRFQGVGILRFYICPDSVLSAEKPLLSRLKKQADNICPGTGMAVVNLAAKIIHTRHGELMKSNVDTVMAADAGLLLGIAQPAENRAMILVTGDGDFARVGSLCIGKTHDLPPRLRPQPRPLFFSAFRDGSLARELMGVINSPRADVIFFQDLF